MYLKIVLLLLLPLLTTSFLSPLPPCPSLKLHSESESHDTWKGDAKTLSSATEAEETVFDINEIAETLPHRYPFALVDRVISYIPGEKAVGIKCVTMNEPHFTGHFPNRPIMPGVLQVEAMAQLAGIICLNLPDAEKGSVFFFAAVDGVKWKKPVTPGDKIYMEVELTNWKAKFGIAKAKGVGYVDGQKCVEIGSMTFAVAKE